MWDIPNCVGPPNSGSLYYNYKGNYSIVHLGTCDANYTFTIVDIGAYGYQSDGGVFWNSGLGQRLLNGNLDLPEDAYLTETRTIFPYFMVGVAVFPPKDCIMRQYPGLYIQFTLVMYLKICMFPK